jgi:hypothetical protein
MFYELYTFNIGFKFTQKPIQTKHNLIGIFYEL